MEAPVQYAPGFLLATPTLVDPNFNRTVVLLFYHDENGAMGIVVNRPSDRKLKDILDVAGLKAADPGLPELPIFWGGPVAFGSGWIIFEGPDPREESFDLGNGLKVTGSLDVFRDLLKRRSARRMLFALGYAGWGPGQLETEMDAGAWFPMHVDLSLLFEVPCSERWHRAYMTLGIDPNLWSITQGEG